METLGWTEGRNLQSDVRWYAGDLARLRREAADLIGLQPDAIVCMSTPTVTALQKATQTVPIVFVNANDPVGFGFVASLPRPGGNITGFVAFEPAMGGKWLQVLREISPVTRVGLVHNPKTHTGQYFQSIESAAGSLSVRPVRIAFGNAADLENAIGNFATQPNGGLLVLPDASTRVHRELIVTMALRHRLPAIYSYRLFVAAGGLAYYGTNTTEQFRKSAEYVDRILKGEKPANLPVQAPTRYELVINFKTAKTLGIEIPPTLLARADEVIE
jgi:putative ABC transport system substrate-binding protein